MGFRGISSRRSTLVVRAEEVDEGQKESLYVVCHGRNLDKKDLFGKSDPFLEFYRFLENGRWVAPYHGVRLKLVLAD